MPIINRIAELKEEMTEWRREMHMHPETAFEEEWTSAFILRRLETFGMDEIHTGIAKTGIVAVLKGQEEGPAIGLRADFDALDILELNDVSYKSKIPGKMHACGHDGHTAMLLGAAKYMAETRNFRGTVYFIFQPAEENEGGGRVMVEDGLFDRFPMKAVYGMHNSPGVPIGHITMGSGPMMAGYDIFEIIIDGYGTHAARPHQGVDPVIIQAQIVMALQTIASRQTDALDSVVLSVTQVHGGDTWNVIPQQVILRGTVRCFSPQVQDLVEDKMRKQCAAIAQAFDANVTVNYERRYPPTINDPEQTKFCAEVACDLAGPDNVNTNARPVMGSEDFSFMLQEKPGCYIRMGNGGPGEFGSVVVHNPRYDFNDDALPWGASYWAQLVEKALPRQK
ncbi:MAG: M20 aminoacylase family protein [Rhodospirillales bacterium]